ncbi:hypothetical protein [Lacticaseibacillus kribbianus]|uniref:hypothetical protein n=1 Tax=Lacticaseibacillus kribbianus TaxID=2926292 RepID=UPI001CD7245F|nr:hypothetical protein [Lacticaseibacillus kribbianus]
MAKEYEVRSLLSRTIKPALLLAPPLPPHNGQEVNQATVDQVIREAAPDSAPADVAAACIRALYLDHGYPFTEASIAAEVQEAARHGLSYADHTAYRLPTQEAIKDFKARGYDVHHLVLDVLALQALLAGQVLGDFTDGEYSHLISLDANAAAWAQAHLR